MPLTDQELKELQQQAKSIRREIVDVTGWSGGAHIGGALSQTDIMTILYWKYLNIDPAKPDWADRDRFILSKGHGGVGYAVVLANRGYFDPELLKEDMVRYRDLAVELGATDVKFIAKGDVVIDEKVIEKSKRGEGDVEVLDQSEEGKKWAEDLENLSPEEPFYVHVNDDDDGEEVEIYIG